MNLILLIVISSLLNILAAVFQQKDELTKIESIEQIFYAHQITEEDTLLSDIYYSNKPLLKTSND